MAGIAWREWCDDSFAEAVLRLNVCDPAMGSGHFLVEAVNVMAEAVAAHPETADPRHAQLGEAAARDFPLSAITQRPMFMYHAWHSQNAWLRQIHTHNYLYVNPRTAAAQGITDGGWMWVESMHGKVRCLCRYSEAVEPGTVWTWNAIGKSKGAWGLSKDANESQRGFLLNHLISEELPLQDGARYSNSDPITGQAGWYDVRVNIRAALDDEAAVSMPQFAAPARITGAQS